jgi:hypothetical protein
MKNGRKAGKRFMLLVVLMVAVASMSAQQTLESSAAARGSNSAQVFLIARMPESLTLALNVNEIKDMSLVADSSMSLDGADVPPTAASVTATWVLAPGRSHVVTWAHVKLQPAKVLVALANSIDFPPYAGTVSDSPFGYGLAPRMTVSSRKLDALDITDSNRVAAKTVSLSDAIETSAAAQLQGNAYIGTVKIQVQALP